MHSSTNNKSGDICEKFLFCLIINTGIKFMKNLIRIITVVEIKVTRF